MPLKASYKKHVLQFKFNAGTSRGVLREKDTWFIKVWDNANPDVIGIGEAAPLVKLSIDDVPQFEKVLSDILLKVNGAELPQNEGQVNKLIQKLVAPEFPSIQFGLETALLDLLHGGNRIIFDNSFSRRENGIPINGLIWMGDMEDMLLQITSKIDEGYDCIKIKIGSLNFEKECDILQYIRSKYYKRNLLLRVDANGAFKPDEALDKLNELAKFNIHSIEQPIMAGQTDMMRQLCKFSPIPVALDEELIGIVDKEEKKELLEKIKPQYIILKPTLVGGLNSCKEWIEIAESLNIGWWITSALESNIGLNAISQYTAQYKTSMHQGLGTGQLYHNNIPSPLEITNGEINYRNSNLWALDNAV